MKVLETLEERSPGSLRGRTLEYATDSQPAMFNLMRMKGSAATFPIVKRTRLLCSRLGVTLEVVWRPREHPEQVRADALSKTEDLGDWELNQQVGRQHMHGSLVGSS